MPRETTERKALGGSRKPAVDLHMHTTYSDGVLSPRQLLTKASSVGLKAVSITDHDNLDAIAEAQPLATELGIELIPGVEMSVSIDNKDIHILAYFIDCQRSALKEYLTFFKVQRRVRAERIVGKLQKQGVKITTEEVLAKAGNGSVGRPHIASVLMEHGYVKGFDEAFHRYIGSSSPAYEKNHETEPAEMLRLITESGGLSFIAHPGRSLSDDALTHLINCGLDGIEIVHPSHSAERQDFYRELTNEYFLLQSGGSDYHGLKPQDEENFGHLGISEKLLDQMKLRLG